MQMENRIIELEEEVRLLLERMDEEKEQRTQMERKIEFLEAEIENTVRGDLTMIEYTKQQSLKSKQYKKTTPSKRLIGYKVVKSSVENSDELEDIVAQHLEEGWAMHEGLCFADRYLCQALVKYTELTSV